MYKTTVTYDSLFEPGTPVTEVLYFHLLKDDLIDLELNAQEVSGDPEKGLAYLLQRVGSGDNGAEIMKTFRLFVRYSYGERQGDKHVKTPEIQAMFMKSPAFDAMLGKFMLDPNEGSNFINKVMPGDLIELSEQVEARMAAQKGKPVEDAPIPELLITVEMVRESGLVNPVTPDGKSLVPWHNREPTSDEIVSMSTKYGAEYMKDVFRRKGSGWTPPAA